MEGRHLLPHIMGHNLCLDIFGAHTEREIMAPVPGSADSVPFKAGMHGEAGSCTWYVLGVEQTSSFAQVSLCAHLRRTCLDVVRTFSVTADSAVVKVHEKMVNRVGCVLRPVIRVIFREIQCVALLYCMFCLLTPVASLHGA